MPLDPIFVLGPLGVPRPQPLYFTIRCDRLCARAGSTVRMRQILPSFCVSRPYLDRPAVSRGRIFRSAERIVGRA